MARYAAFAAGFPSLFSGPLVSGTLLVGNPTAFAGDLPLFLSVH